MKLPEVMPARPSTAHDAVSAKSVAAVATDMIEPAACCAKACVSTPFGEVCHCVLDLPICP